MQCQVRGAFALKNWGDPYLPRIEFSRRSEIATDSLRPSATSARPVERALPSPNAGGVLYIYIYRRAGFGVHIYIYIRETHALQSFGVYRIDI